MNNWAVASPINLLSNLSAFFHYLNGILSRSYRAV